MRAMNAENPSRQEAWALIKQKHEKLAYEEFTIYLRTGHLNLEKGEGPEPIYVLINEGEQSVIFDSGQQILTQAEQKYVELTKNENKRKDKEIAEILRPLVSRLRIKLGEAHESLPNIVKTIRGKGYVYIPHSTLRE
jgi:hypothetical protein